MYCIKCGKKLGDNATMCSNCGKEHPDATPAKKTGKKAWYASMSLIFLVISLCLLPLLGVVILVLFTVGLATEVSITNIFFQIVKSTLIMLSPTLLLSLVFHLLGKG